MLNVIFGVLQPIALHCIALVEGFGVEVAEQTALDNEAKYLARRLHCFLTKYTSSPLRSTFKHIRLHPQPHIPCMFISMY